MKALLFGAPPAEGDVRPVPEDELEAALAGIPFGLHEIDDARPVRSDWVVTRPILSGICGSDAKLVLGDGKSPEGRAQAARLIWEFIVCHAGTPLDPYARADAEKWKLERPAQLACPK